MTIKNNIVSEARSWKGTLYHHQGRIKATLNDKGGCDCIGLLVGVVRDLGIKSSFTDRLGNNIPLYEFDRIDYGREPDGIMIKKSLSKYLQEIKIEEITAGNILLFKFNNNPQHIGIISDYNDNNLGIIHCYAQARKVVEHRLDDLWRSRIVAAYRINNIENQ